MRVISASVDISQEKIPTGIGTLRFTLPPASVPSATFSQMFIASEVFPIEGRAASTIISALRRPLSFSSRFLKPVEMPLMPSLRWSILSILPNVAVIASFHTGMAVCRFSPMARTSCSVSLIISSTFLSGA